MKTNVMRRRYQRGSALLLLAAVLVIVAGWYLYQLYAHPGYALKTLATQRTAQALVEAKENLMLFAISNPEVYGDSTHSPGFLPCPDTRALNDVYSGSPGGTCSWSGKTSLGRVPTQQLTNYFFFSSDEQKRNIPLWYAVSDPLRNIGLTRNPVYDYDTTAVSITLDNDTTNKIAAIVIAAGDPLTGQTGRNETDTTATQWNQYLESMTSANLTTGKFATLASLPSTTPFNDKILTITLADFQKAVKGNVCLRACIGNWCDKTTFNNIPSTNWFKKLKWSDSNGDGTGSARICSINGWGWGYSVNGVNTNECTCGN